MTAQTYEKGKLYQISIIDFKPDPDQPRKVIDPDALAELAASITALREAADAFLNPPGEGVDGEAPPSSELA